MTDVVLVPGHSALAAPSDGVCTKSWILWSATSAEELTAVRQSVDDIFSGFSFYPEAEYATYRFRPPEGHKVFGAWRHPDGIGFVFLLNNPGMEHFAGVLSLILSYDGRERDLRPLLPRLIRLKRELARKNGKRKADKELQTRLQKDAASSSLKRLMGLMAPITAVINGLALYLHKLSPPTIEARWLSAAYGVLLPSTYIAALSLLLIFTVICILYTCKYGFLLLRRL